MLKGVPNKRYTPEFKKLVIETMYQEHLSCSEVGRQFNVAQQRVCDWEKDLFNRGVGRFFIERRGRGIKGRPWQFPKKVEEDLLKKVQRLRSENAYLKNCKL